MKDLKFISNQNLNQIINDLFINKRILKDNRFIDDLFSIEVINNINILNIII